MAPESTTPKAEGDDEDLGDLLSEVRILLPGSQLLAAFLVPLCFTERFEGLSSVDRYLYLATFVSTILALACFVTPAVYHRVARPIHDKRAFKDFVNRFVIAGMVLFTGCLACCTYLITDVVTGTYAAMGVAAAVTVALVVLWWVIPRGRFKHRPD